MKLIAFKNIVPVIIIFAFSIRLAGQQFQIERYNADSSQTDLNQFYKSLPPGFVLGIGESTHGTAEFTKMRLKIITELKSQVKLVILEEDFGYGIYVNTFINDSNSIVNPFQYCNYWPFSTKEIASIFNFLKKHNSGFKDESDRIQFFGMDNVHCSFHQDRFNYLLKKYHLDTLTCPQMKLLRDTSLRNLLRHDSLMQITVKKCFLPNAKLAFNKSINLFSSRDSFELRMLIETAENYLVLSKNGSLRDSLMASNVLKIYKFFKSEPAIIIAHNGHVAKAEWAYQKTTSARLGKCLSLSLKDKYIAVAQDFKCGSFIASAKTETGWDAKTFEIGPLPKRYLSQRYNIDKTAILLKITRKMKKFNILTIGATYDGNFSSQKKLLHIYKSPIFFDWIIIHSRSSPITFSFVW